MSEPCNQIEQDNLLEIGKLLEQLLPLLPQAPTYHWRRFSFDIQRREEGTRLANVRLAEIEEHETW